jgi:hypothetical protein
MFVSSEDNRKLELIGLPVSRAASSVILNDQIELILLNSVDTPFNDANDMASKPHNDINIT